MVENIGERLKNLRTQENYTQQDIAEYLDVSQSQIAKVECGERNLRLTKLLKLADLYNVPIEYILYGGELPEKRYGFKKTKGMPMETLSRMNKILNNLIEMKEIYEKHYGG